MKRAATRNSKLENYEHVLMCLICRSLFDDHDHQPKFLPCHHTFCKDCLREYVRQMGDDIECPSCRKPATIPAAGVAALQTNFYAKYIQSLVYGCSGGIDGNPENECPAHPTLKLQYFCKDCKISVCDACLKTGGSCSGHKGMPLTAVTEQFHQSIDVSFSNANALIERKKADLEALLKAFSEEKDQALLRIDATFEQHAHTLTRRATLLKNKVIDIYNEHVASLDSDLEEISTAMTCIVSLKEFHETAIGRGDFTDADKGIEELDEVFHNVNERIKPRASHIVFEEKYGIEKFRSCIKDLGRVTCHSAVRRPVRFVEGGGGDNGADQSPTTPSNPSDPDFGNNNPVQCLQSNESQMYSDDTTVKSTERIENKTSDDSELKHLSSALENAVIPCIESDQSVGSPTETSKDHQDNSYDSSTDVGTDDSRRLCSGVQTAESFQSEDESSKSEIIGATLSSVNMEYYTLGNTDLGSEDLVGHSAPADCKDALAGANMRPRQYISHSAYGDLPDREVVGLLPLHRMSQSDFWDTLEDSSINERDVIVAELSGEQTSL